MSRVDRASRGSSGSERKHKERVTFDSPLKNAAMDRRSACEKHPTGSTRWRYEDSSRPRNWRADGDGDEAPLVVGLQEEKQSGMEPPRKRG